MDNQNITLPIKQIEVKCLDNNMNLVVKEMQDGRNVLYSIVDNLK